MNRSLIHIQLILFICYATLNQISAQQSEVYDISGVVILDSIVIKAQKRGFDVNDFIEMVQADKTFYWAFKNLRTSGYSWTCDMSFKNRKGKELAAYQSDNTQHWDGQCRKMTVKLEKSTGKYYKRKGDKRFYTTKLYERLFCTDGKICGEKRLKSSDAVQKSYDQNAKGMARHVEELKKLIFSPGQQADVPFIKKKTAIFSDQMAQYYDFTISSEMIGEVDCYTFKAKVKDAFAHKKDKTVIKELVTTFRKTDFQIIKRNYHLASNTAAYTFDVRMEIDLQYIDGFYYPDRILYDGYWNVPFKKYEKGKFEVKFSNFR